VIPVEPKKPKGALAALAFGEKSTPTLEAPSTPADAGFRAVAKAFGIPPERQAAAQEALHQYIKSCTAGAGEEDYDTEEL
jgi:hypothetical protein